MNEKVFETFPAKCHPSDIEHAFTNKIDAFIVSNWLNIIKNIDEFLQTSEVEFEYEISDDLFKKFLLHYEEEV